MAGSGPKQTGAAQLLTSEQKQALQDILGGIDIQGLVDPARQQQFFQQQVADPAREQFEQRTIPALSEELIALGANRGSGLGARLGMASADLEKALAQASSGFQQQGLQNQMQLLNLALGRQAMQPIINPGSAGLLGDLIGSVPAAVIGAL